MIRCSNIGCDDEATAWVPGYPDALPKCFTHEREWADRYGPEEIMPLMTSRASEAWRTGSHSSGAGLAERLDLEYRGLVR